MARTEQTTRYPGVTKRTGNDGKTTYKAILRAADGTKRTKTFPTIGAANKWRLQQLAARDRGDLADPAAGRRTFTAWAQIWVELHPHWRPSTLTAHRAELRRLQPLLGHQRVAAIRTSDVQAAVAALTASGLAPSTVEATARTLAAVLETARRDGAFGSRPNPADGVRLPRDGRSRADRAVALSPDQLQLLLGELPAWQRSLAVVMATAGLRPAEAAGLTADRVDLLHRELRIDRQLVGAEDGVPVFGPPKTASSSRTVRLGAVAVEVLQHHMEEYPPGGSGLVFTTRSGAPLTRQRLGDTWRSAARRSGLPDTARGWHCLRHTYVSAQLAAGTPVTVVSSVVGHRTVAETMQTYSHMMPGADEAARDAAADVLLPQGFSAAAGR